MEHLEIKLLVGKKVIIYKAIIIHLVVKILVFPQQCFVLPITNPIILGSDFLDIHFTVLDIERLPFYILSAERLE